jgi:hypothetical protein
MQDGARGDVVMRVGGVVERERKLRLPRERAHPLAVIENEPAQLPAVQLAFGDQQRCRVPCADIEQELDRSARGRLACGQALAKGTGEIGGGGRPVHGPPVECLVFQFGEHDTTSGTAAGI